MKIERIDTVSFIRAMGMKNSFTPKGHTLEFYESIGVLVDNTHLIPFSNILEIVLERKPDTFDLALEPGFPQIVTGELTPQAASNYKKAMKKAKGE